MKPFAEIIFLAAPHAFTNQKKVVIMFVFFFHATVDINFDNDAQNMVDIINISAREQEVKSERTGRKK